MTGAIASLGTMLAINFPASIIAIAILFSIFQYIKRTAGPPQWADSRRSYHLQLVREHLISAARESQHPRYWRPQILAFSDNPQRRKLLLHFSSWIEGRSGLTTIVRLLKGKGIKMRKKKEAAETELIEDIAKYGVYAFPLVIVTPDINSGLQILIQSYGTGPLKANTILLNWLSHTHKTIFDSDDKDYGESLILANFYRCNIIILDAKADKWAFMEETCDRDILYIDVWWLDDATSRLMLLLAYLITRHEKWSKAKIRLLATGFSEESHRTIKGLEDMLEEVRIEALPQILKDVSVDTISKYSADSSIVFLPFRIKKVRLWILSATEWKILLDFYPWLQWFWRQKILNLMLNRMRKKKMKQLQLLIKLKKYSFKKPKHLNAFLDGELYIWQLCGFDNNNKII